MVEPAPVIVQLDRPTPAERGKDAALEAVFSCRVGGLLLRGLRLRRNAGGRLVVSNPMSSRGHGTIVRGAVIEAPDLYAAILAAAIRAMPDAYDPLAPRRHRGPRRQG